MHFESTKAFYCDPKFILERLTNYLRQSRPSWTHSLPTEIHHFLVRLIIHFVVPLKERAEIIEVIYGEASTIQGPNSEVKLQTPKGAYGVLFGTVHTNHQQFLHLIPDSDCLISPVCEYGFHPDEEKHSPEGMFKLLIPHIVKDIGKVRGHIQVRQATSGDWGLTTDIPQHDNTQNKDAFWEMDNKYIHLHTKHFCKFLITAEGINCCTQSAELLLFGSLEQQAQPTVTVKPYLGSLSYENKDYVKVLYLIT